MPPESTARPRQGALENGLSPAIEAADALILDHGEPELQPLPAVADDRTHTDGFMRSVAGSEMES